MEIFTKLDTITKEDYIRISMEVLHYMGKEGFFDMIMPTKFSIYNKFGQLVRVEDTI